VEGEYIHGLADIRKDKKQRQSRFGGVKDQRKDSEHVNVYNWKSGYSDRASYSLGGLTTNTYNIDVREA
jgi:hypothetical protein